MNAAQLFVKCLENEGVEYLFGIPGEENIRLVDAMNGSSIRFILARSEQGASFMADMYGRVTGKAGVCMGTSGPGATNLVTAIADAYMDSCPLIAITGQVNQNMIGRGAFQETDIIGVTLPVVKHSYLVTDVNDIPRIVKEAFYIAQSGRPGPVVIDIPKDVTDPNIRIPYAYPDKIEMRSYNPVTKGHMLQIKRAVDLMRKAERPVLYVGGGMLKARAAEALREAAKAERFGRDKREAGKGLGEGLPGLGLAEEIEPEETGSYWTDLDDPLAIPAAPATGPEADVHAPPPAPSRRRP